MGLLSGLTRSTGHPHGLVRAVTLGHAPRPDEEGQQTYGASMRDCWRLPGLTQLRALGTIIRSLRNGTNVKGHAGTEPAATLGTLSIQVHGMNTQMGGRSDSYAYHLSRLSFAIPVKRNRQTCNSSLPLFSPSSWKRCTLGLPTPWH